jgi:dimethylamine monooxygenase subunit A
LRPEPITPMPFRGGPFRVRMGLTPIQPAEWLVIGPDYAGQIAEKRRLIAADREAVWQMLPQAQDAAAELGDALAANLVGHHGEHFRRENGRFENRLLGESEALAPGDLGAVIRHVQEDVCLLQPDGSDGLYRLTGASLCFPANWKLAEKLGRPLIAIHEHVPDYEPAVGAGVDRFLQRLDAGRLVTRANWLLSDEPALFQLGKRPLAEAIPLEEIGRRLVMRLERQCFLRLPQTGAVVFSIRTFVLRLEEAVATPADARDLMASLSGMDGPALAYRHIGPVLPRLTAWLESRAG